MIPLVVKSTDPLAVEKSINILKKGGVIVYPTDTLYGFGVDANNNYAIERINKLKNRHSPMSVIACRFEQAMSWTNIKEKDIEIAKKILDSSSTLILDAKKNIVSNKILGKNNTTLGVRIPKHKYCYDISKEYDKPITTTSVNRSGEQPLNDPKSISKIFGKSIDLLIDDGKIKKSAGSKIYELKESQAIRIR
jgi:L-threonylcarbamoyladenylate synthase|tara:strand:+ start:34 stop:612 length:579 start_codon:yes stop_codon:yes gene_type:complete